MKSLVVYVMVALMSMLASVNGCGILHEIGCKQLFGTVATFRMTDGENCHCLPFPGIFRLIGWKCGISLGCFTNEDETTDTVH